MRVLLVAPLFLLALGCGDRSPPLAKVPAPIVQTAYPIVREVADYQDFTARTVATQSVNVIPRVTGFLNKINIADGAIVKEGQVLFEIDPRQYAAQLEQANGEVAYNKAALEKAEADLSIGLATQKDNPGAISQQDITRRQGARDEAAGSLMASIGKQALAQLNLDWCKVTAPISGRSNRHLVDVGSLVTENETVLINIVTEEPMWIYFEVDEATALKVRKLISEGKMTSAVASSAPVQIGLALSDQFPFTGYTDFVSNQVDPDTGSITLRATYPNKDGKLLAGLFARVRVPISNPHEGLLVADSAVGTNQNERFVLVVNDKNVIEYRAVDVGQMHEGLVEVLRYRTITEPGAGPEKTKTVEVLTPQDRIVVNGLQRVRPGVTCDPQMVDMLTMLSILDTPASSKPTADKPKPPANPASSASPASPAEKPDAQPPAAPKDESAPTPPAKESNPKEAEPAPKASEETPAASESSPSEASASEPSPSEKPAAE